MKNQKIRDLAAEEQKKLDEAKKKKEKESQSERAYLLFSGSSHKARIT